ncbi:MAG TPA: Flp family type IVb pilin [Acetobacteraceae bacterium]|nr:Flp family type IVb pilin [Acetobacteraceae bacterium]
MPIQCRTKTEHRNNRRAVTALEYALIAAAVALAISSSVIVLGSQLDRTLDHLWDLMRQSYSHRSG